jgi:glutamate 5-kinase
MSFSKDKTIIIKIGSAVLVHEGGGIDEKVIANICQNIAKLKAQNYNFAIVSSGAIHAGMEVVDQQNKKHKLKKKQALAAVGQVHLMQLYKKAFLKYGISIGQILLSHEDFKHRKSFLNTRSTLTQLLDLDVVPIINENDTVSTEEIQFGDNDQMSVLIANALESEQIVFMSTTLGLMDLEGKNQKIDLVEKIDKTIFAMAKGGNAMGSGGMGSKLVAIDTLNKAGKTAWLVHGKQRNILKKLFSEKNIGTRFNASTKQKKSKQLWMLQNLSTQGKVKIDKGAFNALSQNKASLLVQGITSIEGNFELGQLISVEYNKKEVARGMARLNSKMLIKILEGDKNAFKKLESSNISKFLIHRDDLVIIAEQD